MIERLSDVEPAAVVEVLVSAQVATSESAMGECLHKAAALAGQLEVTNWEIFDAIASLADERKTAADAIRSSVCQALARDEHVISLAPALKEAQAKAVRLLTTPTPIPGPKAEPQPVPRSGRTILQQGQEQHLNIRAAQDLIARLEHELQAGQDIHFNIGWIIEEGRTEQ